MNRGQPGLQREIIKLFNTSGMNRESPGRTGEAPGTTGTVSGTTGTAPYLNRGPQRHRQSYGNAPMEPRRMPAEFRYSYGNK
ncbi:hypothetical protein DPMN_078841 [Dreissena polymorpha]|uniref:Uncharacterized protein n=1 Tax=Dreissena polymorpha TaxID=45954 RepID=A0A9D3YRC6_DREPO|nr:hypothetical protein DPMN_078841 [Dreissena polymorpha]